MGAGVTPLTYRAVAEWLAARSGSAVARPADVLERLVTLWLAAADRGSRREPEWRELVSVWASTTLASWQDDSDLAPVLSVRRGLLEPWLARPTVLRLPAGLAVQGVELVDMVSLADRWAEQHGPARTVDVIGVRTGGGYLAPIFAARLADHGIDAAMRSCRPADAARSPRDAVLVDDPPLTGGTLRQLCAVLGPRTSVAVPVFDPADVAPLRQAGIASTILPRQEWASSRRLHQLAEGGGGIRWLGTAPAKVEPFDELPLTVRTPWPSVRRRSAAKVGITLIDLQGTRSHAVASWVPPGMFGDPARAAAALQHPSIPGLLGLGDGTIVQRYESATVCLNAPIGRRQLASVLGYVLDRSHRLPLDHANGTADPWIDEFAESFLGLADGKAVAALLTALPATLPDNRLQAEKLRLREDGSLVKHAAYGHAYRRDNQLLAAELDMAAAAVLAGLDFEQLWAELASLGALGGRSLSRGGLALAGLVYAWQRGKQAARTYNPAQGKAVAQEMFALQTLCDTALAAVRPILTDDYGIAAGGAAHPVGISGVLGIRPPLADSILPVRLRALGIPEPDGPSAGCRQYLDAVAPAFGACQAGEVILLWPLGQPSALPRGKDILDRHAATLPPGWRLGWHGTAVLYRAGG